MQFKCMMRGGKEEYDSMSVQARGAYLAWAQLHHEISDELCSCTRLQNQCSRLTEVYQRYLEPVNSSLLAHAVPLAYLTLAPLQSAIWYEPCNRTHVPEAQLARTRLHLAKLCQSLN